MTKKSKNNNNDIQQEQIIQKALRISGFICPETPEEVIEFEKKFGTTDLTLPEELREPSFLAKPDTVFSKKAKTISENLAMAAREGSRLPEEVLQKMKEHRDKANREKKKK